MNSYAQTQDSTVPKLGSLIGRDINFSGRTQDLLDPSLRYGKILIFVQHIQKVAMKNKFLIRRTS